MAMAQNDKNARITQKAFEMVDNVRGKSQKMTYKLNSRFNQKFYEYGAPKVGLVEEATSTITLRRVIYQYSNDSTTINPVVYGPTDHIQYFGGAHPSTGHADCSVRPKERIISCDEAFQRYGGVLIKEFRN